MKSVFTWKLVGFFSARAALNHRHGVNETEAGQNRSEGFESLTCVALWNCFFRPATDIFPHTTQHKTVALIWTEPSPEPRRQILQLDPARQSGLKPEQQIRPNRAEPSRTKTSWIYFQSAREKGRRRSSNRKMGDPGGESVAEQKRNRTKSTKIPKTRFTKVTKSVMYHSDENILIYATTWPRFIYTEIYRRLGFKYI